MRVALCLFGYPRVGATPGTSSRVSSARQICAAALRGKRRRMRIECEMRTRSQMSDSGRCTAAWAFDAGPAGSGFPNCSPDRLWRGCVAARELQQLGPSHWHLIRASRRGPQGLGAPMTTANVPRYPSRFAHPRADSLVGHAGRSTLQAPRRPLRSVFARLWLAGSLRLFVPRARRPPGRTVHVGALP